MLYVYIKIIKKFVYFYLKILIMKIIMKIILSLYAIFTNFNIGLSHLNLKNSNNLDKLVKTKIIYDNFKNIQKGKFRFWQTSDCLTILYKDSPFYVNDGCYFQNPDAPYGLILLPPHHDEIIDDYYGFPVSDGNLSATWHMKKNEVIILFGKTPPECKYFSFSNYLYSRHFPENWKPNNTDSRINLNCPNGNVSSRCEIFASLDDSVNLHRGMNLENQTFDSDFVLILSPNFEATYISEIALMKIGISKNIITNYTYPGKYLKLGIDSEDDTFITILRTAFYKNKTQADYYFNNIPFSVVRMELKNENVHLFDKKPLVNRKTKFDDATKMNITLPELKKNLDIILKSVVDKLTFEKKKYFIQITETKSGAPDNGFECINNGTMCLADCRDTLYPFSTSLYKLAKICQKNNTYCRGNMDATLLNNIDEVILVIGVNHAMTNMSKYSSVSIYDANHLWGVYSVGNKELEKTVYKYISKDILYLLKGTLPYIYVYEFRRNCNNIKNCLEIPTYPNNEIEAFIPISNSIAITERMYDNPNTHVGPYLNDVILPYIVHIRPK